jgi:hypothetical protein
VTGIPIQLKPVVVVTTVLVTFAGLSAPKSRAEVLALNRHKDGERTVADTVKVLLPAWQGSIKLNPNQTATTRQFIIVN